MGHASVYSSRVVLLLLRGWDCLGVRVLHGLMGVGEAGADSLTTVPPRRGTAPL